MARTQTRPKITRSRSAVRLRLLQAIQESSHRYDLWRALGMSLTLGFLAFVPLSGLARVDLWRGHHALLFRSASFKEGLAGVIVGIGVTYVLTFLVNVVGGRLFCGWGCPVGQLNRWNEALQKPRLPRRERWRLAALGGLFNAALVLAVMAWWVDLRILWAGHGEELLVAWGVAGVGMAAAFAHGRWWRWGFCMSTCPIGLYYSFVSPSKRFGVYFRNEAKTCIECNACDNVCPVDLAPRDLMSPTGPRPGLSLDGAPGRNHCLECGDCVRACEWMIDRAGEEPVPLLLGYFSGPQRLDPGDLPDTEKTPPEPSSGPGGLRS